MREGRYPLHNAVVADFSYAEQKKREAVDDNFAQSDQQ